MVSVQLREKAIRMNLSMQEHQHGEGKNEALHVTHFATYTRHNVMNPTSVSYQITMIQC